VEKSLAITYATVAINVLWPILPSILPSKNFSHTPPFRIIIFLSCYKNWAFRTNYSAISNNLSHCSKIIFEYFRDKVFAGDCLKRK